MFHLILFGSSKAANTRTTQQAIKQHSREKILCVRMHDSTIEWVSSLKQCVFREMTGTLSCIESVVTSKLILKKWQKYWCLLAIKRGRWDIVEKKIGHLKFENFMCVDLTYFIEFNVGRDVMMVLYNSKRRNILNIVDHALVWHTKKNHWHTPQ